MQIRKYSVLAKNFAGPKHPIDESYAELRFLRFAAAGDEEGAAALFREKKMFFDEPCAVDMPYGRFEGPDGIRECVRGFRARFHADSAEVVPVIQTRSGGRSVTELEVHFTVDGMIEMVPMFVVADLRTKDLLEEVRVYCHCSYVPDLQAYRKPMFTPAHLEMGDPGLLTGAVREYYEALHHVPGTDVARVLACCQPDCLFGGYTPVTEEEYEAAGGPMTPERVAAAQAHMNEAYNRMREYIPSGVGMRYETIIDDGVTGIIEWVHIVTEKGRDEYSRIALSGIAAYERGEEGLLCSIRISDYAWLEKTIDWSKTGTTLEEAQKVNLVKEFPAGCGRKPQH